MAFAKMEEVERAADLLLHTFRAHGPFMVRWNSQARQKEIRSGAERDAAVWGLIPAFAWRTVCRPKPVQAKED